MGLWLRRLVALLVGLIFLTPLLWLFFTALKPISEVYSTPLAWLPKRWTLENLLQAMTQINVPHMLKNTSLIAVFSSLGAVVSSSLVAFAFVVLPVRHKQFWLLVLLFLTAIPPTITLIPKYILTSRLGWLDTPLPLVLPFFCAPGFYVLMLMAFLQRLPKALFESAFLDGASPLELYWHIALPLLRPALLVVAALSFTASWNDFLAPLMYLQSEHWTTISLGLASFQSINNTRLEWIAPLALLAAIPPVVIFGLVLGQLKTLGSGILGSAK
jgi:multiple sugar transport system permease protein